VIEDGGVNEPGTVNDHSAAAEDGVEPAARAALENMLDVGVARRATVAPLEGGLHGRNYLVIAGAKRWVLRLPTSGAEALLDLATETSVLRAAAAAGLAPAVAGVDLARGALLTEYHAGARPWTARDARVSANVVRVAALLRRLHALAAHAPDYRAERIARKYLTALSAAVDAGRVRFDARARQRADELLALAREYDAAHRPTALCHNDLVAENVLDGSGPARGGGLVRDGGAALDGGSAALDGGSVALDRGLVRESGAPAGDAAGLVFVDFEYAVRAAPVLDLAGLAGLNDYGKRECRELLAAYYDGARAQVSLDELARIVRMVRLVAFFWARLGELGAAASAPYAQLADELDRRLK
jgi:thiamine kinase-like enzyme